MVRKISRQKNEIRNFTNYMILNSEKTPLTTYKLVIKPIQDIIKQINID